MDHPSLRPFRPPGRENPPVAVRQVALEAHQAHARATLRRAGDQLAEPIEDLRGLVEMAGERREDLVARSCGPQSFRVAREGRVQVLQSRRGHRLFERALGEARLVAPWVVADVHQNLDLFRPEELEELLERELDWHRRLPVWFLPPAALSTAAIALTFYSSARFAHTPVFFAMMAWIVVGGGLALVIGLKRSRREADRWQRELDALGAD